MNDSDAVRIRHELRQAVHQLSSRGLYQSAQWSAELLTQIKLSDQAQAQQIESKIIVQPEIVPDNVLLAKTHFDLKEYQRAAHALIDSTHPHALFLRNYSLFMAGEKRKEEESLEKSNNRVLNRELVNIKAALLKHRPLDGFCWYLYGIVLQNLDQEQEARQALCESVNMYPWNWSAWRALTSLCHDRDTSTALQLNDHWMRRFFQADVFLELHQHEHQEVLNMLDELADDFPNSSYLLVQTAMAHYNMREFDEAQELFEELREADEYRLSHMDTYSNILYVKEAKGALSYLAHNAVLNDKYRPETCCIVGNYYSLKGQHEKAVIYFKRALKLDCNYLSAWTLMGHEYVEMRNTSAAIEAYRRAVDINPRDYRAWYGLGQTYEILQMHTYSLYYFRKATNLRPYDPRMWCAMAESYERLGRSEEAITCYKRAEGNEDREGIALSKLAKLYNGLGDEDSSAHYFLKVLDKRGNDEVEGQDTLDALLFLAHYCKRKQRFAEATKYCNRLLDIGGPAKEQAKSLLAEIRNISQRSTDIIT